MTITLTRLIRAVDGGMIGPGTGVRVYLACGARTCARGSRVWRRWRRIVLRQKPTGGAVFAFRGRKGDRLKLLYWDGQGFCLYYKVLERGRFPWPNAPPTGGASDLGAAGDAVGRDRLARPDWGAPPARVG
jgi:transposase